MLEYRSVDEIIRHPGLRIVLVRGLPSPWGQAAKTIFEVKGLEYVVAPFNGAGSNDEVVAWAGEDSGPIVAWANEKPIHRWLDILYLAERLAPAPAMFPADVMERALMVGLSNEICGELGIGWNRRLQIFSPMIESGNAPDDLSSMMRDKYGYSLAAAQAAGARTVESLKALSRQLKSQYARGMKFFVGDALSAVDIYWAAFMNLIDPLPAEQCPMPEALRPAFATIDSQIEAALDPILIEHRHLIFDRYFRSPMEV